MNETIISVGLVKPKTGIFQSYVKYLLILTTTVEITILGVTISDDTQGNNLLYFYLFVFLFKLANSNYLYKSTEMQLVPEPIFTVATDGIGIATIANTNSGRIFLGGRNGSLFEIYYQVKFKILTLKILKTNITLALILIDFSVYRQRAAGLVNDVKKLIILRVHYHF